MILDLASTGFEQLGLDIVLDASHDAIMSSWVAAGLEEGHEFDDGFHYAELASFLKNGRTHKVSLHLVDSTSGKAHLNVGYFLGESDLPKGSRVNLRKIHKVLDSLSVPCVVSCFATGHFPLDQHKPILTLPLMKFNMPHEYFDEIRGIRLAKLKDGVEDESAALDFFKEGEIHVFVQTRYSAVIDAKVPASALQRLVNLKDHAVTKVQSGASEGA